MTGTITGTLVGSERRRRTEDIPEALIKERSRGRGPRDLANEREGEERAAVQEHDASRREARRHMWATHYRMLARKHADMAARLENKANQLQEV